MSYILFRWVYFTCLFGCFCLVALFYFRCLWCFGLVFVLVACCLDLVVCLVLFF